jgi:hypothetical protein
LEKLFELDAEAFHAPKGRTQLVLLAYVPTIAAKLQREGHWDGAKAEKQTIKDAVREARSKDAAQAARIRGLKKQLGMK